MGSIRHIIFTVTVRKNKSATTLLAALFFFFLFLASSPAHQMKLVLNTPGEPPYHYPDQTGILDLWLKEAFQRIGIEVAVQKLPAERALINANEGVEDGDAIRIAGLSQKYPNLIQVPEIVYAGEFVVFTKKNLPAADWETMRTLNVGYIQGHKICEQNLVPSLTTYPVASIETLFNLLKYDRVDAVIVERLFGLAEVKKNNMRDVRVLEPPLAQIPFYLYLHKKHLDLVPEITLALKEIKKNGSHERIYRQGLSALDISAQD